MSKIPIDKIIMKGVTLKQIVVEMIRYQITIC